jgi:hypothetical protein
MPNIYIKTRMRKMPECCQKCDWKAPKMFQENYPACVAQAHDATTGRQIFTKVTKQRPTWCPLVEIKEGQAND